MTTKVDTTLLRNEQAQEYLAENHPDLNEQMEKIAQGHQDAYELARMGAINRGDAELVEKIDKLYQKSDLSRPEGYSVEGMGLVKAAVMTTAVMGFGKQLAAAIPGDLAGDMQGEYGGVFQNTVQNTTAAEQSFSGAMNNVTQAMQATIAGPQMQMGQNLGAAANMARMPGLGNVV